RLDLRNVTERGGHLEACEHLTQRPECRVVARGSVLPARIRAFCHIERRAAERSLALPGEIGIATFELFDQWPDRPNELQEDGIDAKHGETPWWARAPCAGTQPVPLRAQELSRLRAKRAPRAAARRPASI